MKKFIALFCLLITGILILNVIKFLIVNKYSYDVDGEPLFI